MPKREAESQRQVPSLNKCISLNFGIQPKFLVFSTKLHYQTFNDRLFLKKIPLKSRLFRKEIFLKIINEK